MKAQDRVSDAELHAFVDGQLADQRAREVAAWLGEHATEAQRVGGWRAQNDAIRRAFPPLPRERIAAPLREAPQPAPAAGRGAPSLVDYRTRLRRRRAIALSVAFAFGALATIVLGAMAQKLAFPPTPEPARVEIVHAGHGIGTLAASSWRAYAQDRAHPVEVSARDRAALSAWIAERTGLAPLPETPGLRLVGGRVVPGHAAPAAFLLYETGEGERIVLVAEAAGAEPLGPAPEAGAGVAALVWKSGGFVFGLAGSISRARMESLAAGFGERRRP
ncbi:MAG: hypothetical protein U1E28_03985 [Beijerinckiaceae bacterium]